MSRRSIDYSIAEAGAVIAMVPSIAVFAALQKVYVTGLTAGAVKR